MARVILRAAAVAACVLLAGAVPMPGAAQPAASFVAPCDGLRKAVARLNWDGEEIVTISVRGKLRAVRSDSALVYLFLCEAPAPRVLCVTYQTNGSREGDEVVVTGNYIPRGQDHIQLDPCLHHAAEE